MTAVDLGMVSAQRRARVVDALSSLRKIGWRSDGHGSACCPAHRDQTPSLAISLLDDRAFLHCNAGCSQAAVVGAMGLAPADLFFADRPGPGAPVEVDRRYPYEDAQGATLYATARLNRRGNRFRMEHPDGSGGWLPGRGGHPPMLYRLPQILALPTDGGVWCTEGERDADSLQSIGICGTTVPSNAWGQADLSALAGLHGVVICDADDAGIRLGATRARLLRAAGVRLPDSAVLFPVVPGLKKPDLSDAFAWAEHEFGRDHEDFEVRVLMTLQPVSEWVPMPSFEERMEGYFARIPTGVERCGPLGARIYICLSRLAAGSGRARATKSELASYLGVGPKAVTAGLAQLIADGYLIQHKRPWYFLPHESPGGDAS